jgi:hypothetical protein
MIKLTKDEWLSLKLVSQPTKTHGMIRRDEDGMCFEYVFNTKRRWYVRQTRDPEIPEHKEAEKTS